MAFACPTETGCWSPRTPTASGAVLGAAGTVLLAVYGPALATAIAALGASGGVWGFISAMSEGSTPVLRVGPAGIRDLGVRSGGDRCRRLDVLATPQGLHP